MGFGEHFLHWGAMGEETPQQNLNLGIVVYKVINIWVFFFNIHNIKGFFLVFLCLNLQKGN